MLIHLLFIVACVIVHSGSVDVVRFQREKMQNSLRLQKREVFKDEFPCLTNGTKDLAVFSVILENNSSEKTLKFSPYDVPVRVNWTLESPKGTQLQSGSFNVSCIRDTVCENEYELQFFVCDMGGISPYCESVLNQWTPCQWIDLTGKSLYAHYWLNLTLVSDEWEEQISPETITLDFVPNSLKKLNIASATATALFMLGLSLPQFIFFLITIITTARRNKDTRNYKSYRMHAE